MVKQGITSTSYYPPSGEIISEAWAEEVQNLYRGPGVTPERLTVRCNMVLKGVPDAELNSHLQTFKEVFELYNSLNCPIVAQFTRELYDPPALAPNADFDQLTPYPTNPYIRGFAARAQRVSDFLAAHTAVTDYIIWNEPNGPVMPLDADHFAALLHHCWKTMQNAFRIHWGGVLLSHVELTGIEHPHEARYIDAVYQWLVDQRLAGPNIDRWPWDGVNLHIHHERSTTIDPTNPDQPGYLVKTKNMLNQLVRGKRADPGSLLIGEWGVSFEEFEPHRNKQQTPLTIGYQGIRDILQPDLMFFFAHPYVDERPGGVQWGLRDADGKSMLFEPYRRMLRS